MLTPVDLETMVFRRSMRGYNIDEVQEFMTRITRDYERLYRENIDLKEAVETREAQLDKYKAIEDTMRNAMLLAQSTAEETKNSAKREADLILSEAEQHGDNIRAKVNEEIKSEIQKLAALKNQVDYFKAQFKNFLSSMMEITDKHLDLNEKLEQTIKNGEAQLRTVTPTDAAPAPPKAAAPQPPAEEDSAAERAFGGSNQAAAAIDSTPQPQQFIDKNDEASDEDDFDFGSIPRAKASSFFMKENKAETEAAGEQKAQDNDFENTFSFFGKK